MYKSHNNKTIRREYDHTHIVKQITNFNEKTHLFVNLKKGDGIQSIFPYKHYRRF